MAMRNLIRLCAFFFLLVLPACGKAPVVSAPGSSQPSNLPPETVVRNIPLAVLDKPSAEISGMAWYGDWLILLPQYPKRLSSVPGGSLYGVSKEDILAYLDGKVSQPLLPREIPIVDSGIEKSIKGFEGFEAIAFFGNRVYLAIESNPGGRMQGYIISGTIDPNLSGIELDPASMKAIDPQANLSNLTDEAILVTADEVLTFYEANGAQVNPNPIAHRFDHSLNPLTPVRMPNLEYRLTDSTPPDDHGRFWVINYFYPGDKKLLPAKNPLSEKFPLGATHRNHPQVEQLVEMLYQHGQVSLVDRAPLRLQLADDGEARNWEGIARLDERGFLLVTDSFPATILGFTGYP